MFDLIVSYFLERGVVCVDEISMRRVAVAIVHENDYSIETCGHITGVVIQVRALPTLYVFPSGLGLRVVEGTYLGKTIYFLRWEYSI